MIESIIFAIKAFGIAAVIGAVLAGVLTIIGIVVFIKTWKRIRKEFEEEV